MKIFAVALLFLLTLFASDSFAAGRGRGVAGRGRGRAVRPIRPVARAIRGAAKVARLPVRAVRRLARNVNRNLGFRQRALFFNGNSRVRNRALFFNGSAYRGRNFAYGNRFARGFAGYAGSGYAGSYSAGYAAGNGCAAPPLPPVTAGAVTETTVEDAPAVVTITRTITRTAQSNYGFSGSFYSGGGCH